MELISEWLLAILNGPGLLGLLLALAVAASLVAYPAIRLFKLLPLNDWIAKGLSVVFATGWFLLSSVAVVAVRPMAPDAPAWVLLAGWMASSAAGIAWAIWPYRHERKTSSTP